MTTKLIVWWVLLPMWMVLAPYTITVHWPVEAPVPVIETLNCMTDSECEDAEATLEPWTWAPLGCEDDCFDPEPGSGSDELFAWLHGI